jgi:hypothetical protein
VRGWWRGLGTTKSDCHSHRGGWDGTLRNNHSPQPFAPGLKEREGQETDGTVAAHLAPIRASRRVEYVEKCTIRCAHPNPEICRGRRSNSHIKDVSRWVEGRDLKRGRRATGGHPQGCTLRLTGEALQPVGGGRAASYGGVRLSPFVAGGAPSSDDQQQKHRQANTMHGLKSTASGQSEVLGRRSGSVTDRKTSGWEWKRPGGLRGTLRKGAERPIPEQVACCALPLLGPRRAEGSPGQRQRGAPFARTGRSPKVLRGGAGAEPPAKACCRLRGSRAARPRPGRRVR